jgi:hypothetical protein
VSFEEIMEVDELTVVFRNFLSEALVGLRMIRLEWQVGRC